MLKKLQGIARNLPEQYWKQHEFPAFDISTAFHTCKCIFQTYIWIIYGKFWWLFSSLNMNKHTLTLMSLALSSLFWHSREKHILLSCNFKSFGLSIILILAKFKQNNVIYQVLYILPCTVHTLLLCKFKFQNIWPFFWL